MNLSLKQYAILAAVLLVLGSLAYAKWEHDRASKAVAAAQQSQANEQQAKETTRIVERTFTNERQVEHIAEQAADEVQSQPGSDTPVPSDVLSSWRRGLHYGSTQHPNP